LRPTEKNLNTRHKSEWRYVRSAPFMTLCSEGVGIVDASCEQRFSLQEKNAHKGNGEYEDGRTTNVVRIRHGFAHHRSRRNSETYGGFSRSR